MIRSPVAATIRTMVETTDDTLICRRCHTQRTADELDGMLWCEECTAAERRRAAWWGRGLAFLAAVLLALWIALFVRPAADFRILWAVLLVFAYYLFTRLARELAYGVIRIRNSAGARASDEGDQRPGPR